MLKYQSLLKVGLASALFLGGINVLVQGSQSFESSLGRVAEGEAETTELDRTESFERVLQEARGPAFPALLEYVFGEGAEEARAAIEEDDQELFRQTETTLGEKLEESQGKIRKPSRKRAMLPAVLAAAQVPNLPFQYTVLTAALQEVPAPAEPQVNQTPTGTSVSGSTRKTVAVEGGTLTRTNSAENQAIIEGKTRGVEYKTTEILEGKLQAGDKAFRSETLIMWRVEVAACPDANGIATGTGTASVRSKNSITEGGSTVDAVRTVTIQMQMKGFVNDEAELMHYDMEGEVTEEASGFAEAFRRGFLKEATHKDGTRRVSYTFSENKAGTNDSTDRGIVRTPPQRGKITVKQGPGTSLDEARSLEWSSGRLIGTVWDEANSQYQRARSNWRNYGCVSVNCSAPKSRLAPGEQIRVTAESVHKDDNAPVNGKLQASGVESVTPEERPGAKAEFVLTAPAGAEATYIVVESISKRGIGIGGVEFGRALKEEPGGAEWSGTVTAERKRREEREKRSGANLEENGGYMEFSTRVQLTLSGRRDPAEDARNAFFGQVSASVENVDYEYDRYKVDEGYCGKAATPYKGRLEKTRTSKTTASLDNDVRYVIDADAAEGRLIFNLPEMTGMTLHSYTHESACPDNDRANTNKASNETTADGGSYAVTFPIRAGQQQISGSATVREDGGSTTTYTWNLQRRAVKPPTPPKSQPKAQPKAAPKAQPKARKTR